MLIVIRSNSISYRHTQFSLSASGARRQWQPDRWQRHDRDREGHLAVGIIWAPGRRPAQRAVAVPARMLQAASPFLFGVLLDRVGNEAAGLSAGLCLAAFGSLFLLRPRCAVAARPSPVRS